MHRVTSPVPIREGVVALNDPGVGNGARPPTPSTHNPPPSSPPNHPPWGKPQAPTHPPWLPKDALKHPPRAVPCPTPTHSP